MSNDFATTDRRAILPAFPEIWIAGLSHYLRALRYVEHGDSLGIGHAGAGDVQWMTAGSGITIKKCRRAMRRAACTAFSFGPICHRR